MSAALKVSLYGDTLGYIAKDPNGGQIVFEYDHLLVKNARFAPSPVTMPLRVAPYSFPVLLQTSFQGLPGLIADSLPDRYGTQVIKDYFESIGEDPAQVGPLEMLAYIGKRAFGGLEFTPQVEHLGLKKDITLGIFKLWDESRQVLLRKDREPLPEGMDLVYQFGSTAGGARAKAAILFNKTTREFKVEGQAGGSGAGFFPWLIKFDGLSKESSGSPLPYERMEYAYSQMAMAAGLNAPESDFFEEESGMFHFMVKRFDRTDPEPGRAGFGKIHMQTFSALRHFDHNLQQVHDYNSFFKTCQALIRDQSQMEEAFRRLVFNVVTHNYDDHTKNLSFLMNPRGTWTLAPTYDNVFTAKKGWFSKGHQMTISGKSIAITRDDLVRIIDPYGLKDPGKIIDQVRDGVSHWTKLAKKAGLTKLFPDYTAEVTKKLKEVDVDR